MACVEGLDLSSRANCTPDLPGIIQSKMTKSGLVLRSSCRASSACKALNTLNPAWVKLIEMSSAIDGSSSTIKISCDMRSAIGFANHIVFGRMTHIRTLHNVNNKLSNIFSMITNALNCFCNEEQVQASRNHFWIFSHIRN